MPPVLLATPLLPGLLLWSIPPVCEAAALPCRICHFMLRIGTFPVAYALTFGCRFTGFEYGNSRTRRGWKQGGPRIFSRLMRKIEVPKSHFWKVDGSTTNRSR